MGPQDVPQNATLKTFLKCFFRYLEESWSKYQHALENMDNWGVLPVVMGSEVRDQVRNGATVVRGGEMGRRRRRGTARTTQLQCWHIIHLEYRWMYTDTVYTQCIHTLFTHRWRWEAELVALQKHSYWLLKCLSACVCICVHVSVCGTCG